ncbi:MAG TPA: HAD family hydrolase [Gemmatimonadales bacterium]|jgi:histidinol-phosphate phosphatase family protein|nr:HAD family hydrolase [Gemmatimonadales bacterium]
MNPTPGHRAVFLDRDGTLMRDTGYPRHRDDVSLLAGAADALSLLAEAGYLRVVITNQSGIARGRLTLADFQVVQAELESRLAQQGASIDATYWCPHLPDAGCTCRKPGTALHREAAARLGIDLTRSWYVGDKPSDTAPAVELGGRQALVTGDSTLLDIARRIMAS